LRYKAIRFNPINFVGQLAAGLSKPADADSINRLGVYQLRYESSNRLQFNHGSIDVSSRDSLCRSEYRF